MTSLIEFLDANAHARRPETASTVWLAPPGALVRADIDDLLREVITRMVHEHARVELLGDRALMAADFEAPGFVPLGPGRWLVPATLDVASFLGSARHSEGNYTLVAGGPAVMDLSGLPALPWWGGSAWRSRAARIVKGVVAARASVIVAVHPDASDCIIAIAPAFASGLRISQSGG